MTIVHSRAARSQPKNRRKSPLLTPYLEGSESRARIEAHVRAIIGRKPQPYENLPAIYWKHVTDLDGFPFRQEFVLTNLQLQADSGLLELPLLNDALGPVMDAVCDQLEAGKMRWKVAERTVRIAATVYRLFQLWEATERHLPIQLEPEFVARWMRFPNDGERMCGKLREYFLDERIEGATHRQQKARAAEQKAKPCQCLDEKEAQKQAREVRYALAWLTKIGFIEVCQRYSKVKAWHAIPRYQLAASPVLNVAESTYPNTYDFKRQERQGKSRKRAIARAKAVTKM